jgi:hypothetical protein
MTKAIQTTKINAASPFLFKDNAAVEFPLAPLVTAKRLTKDPKSIIKLRIMVFIDADYKGKDPYCTLVESATKLVVNVNYDYTEKKPKSYTTWYIELDHTPKTANITKTETFLVDTDPIASRGTETSVAT